MNLETHFTIVQYSINAPNIDLQVQVDNIHISHEIYETFGGLGNLSLQAKIPAISRALQLIH